MSDLGKLSKSLKFRSKGIHYSPYVRFEDRECGCGSKSFIGMSGTSSEPPLHTPDAKYSCFKCHKISLYGELIRLT